MGVINFSRRRVAQPLLVRILQGNSFSAVRVFPQRHHLSMFKKKAGVKRDIRSRTIGDDEDDARAGKNGDIGAGSSQISPDGPLKTNNDTESGSAVVLKKRKVQSSNPLAQGPSSGYRVGSSRKQETGQNEDEYDFYQPDDDHRAGIKSDASKTSARRDDDATRTNTWYDDAHKNQSGAKADVASNDDGVYRGKAAYNTFTSTSNTDNSTKPKGMAKGPVRANNNVRTVTMIDYQPSVCKPYKETGMCGYGDSCIYLHDRSDYLAGWQLDKVPNNSFDKRGDLLRKTKEEEEEDLPFACLICRKKFTDPVVTKCGHYFCMSCAIKRYEKTSKCFACNRQTQGIFNSATKILDRMASIRSALQEEREANDWNKEDDDDNQQTSGEILEGVEIGNI